MNAEYTLHRTPSRDGATEDQPLHARFSPRGTVSTDQLIDSIVAGSTFTRGDLKGALQLFSDGMSDKLKEGFNVELDGFGFYSLSLESRPVQTPEEIRSQSVSFHHVTFRNSKTLTAKLSNIHFSRKENVTISPLTPEQRRERVITYLQNNPTSGLSRRMYSELTGCTRYKALKELDELVTEGLLVCLGRGNVMLYAIKHT